MSMAREVRDQCQRPPILDLLNAPYSCITHARQYLASIVSGKSSRLMMLWRHCGCSGLHEWYETCKDRVRLTRRLVMIADSSLYRRFTKIMRKRHWWILRVVDERISFTARLREAEDFFRRGMCCFYMGFAREVRRMAASGRDLLENPFWQTRLRFTARILTLQVADIEWRHGRTRQKSGHDGKDTMTQMVAA